MTRSYNTGKFERGGNKGRVQSGNSFESSDDDDGNDDFGRRGADDKHIAVLKESYAAHTEQFPHMRFTDISQALHNQDKFNELN